MIAATPASRIAVVVLTWNGLDDLARCLDSFACVEHTNYEILVVNNGSEDDTSTIVRERWPRVTLIENGANLGYAGGNNIGIRQALERAAEYVLILDNDATVTPTLLSELLRVLESDPRIAIAGAKNLLMDDPSRIWGRYGALTWGPMLASIIGRDQPDAPTPSPQDVDWVIGNGCMIRRAALERVGLFDEILFQVHADIDWSQRARKAGYRVVYVDTATVHHKGAGSADLTRSTTLNYGYLLGRNSILFARKHATQLQWARLLAMMLAGLVVRMSVATVKRILFTVPGHSNFVRGVLDGFAGRLRPECAFGQSQPRGHLAYQQVDPPWA